MLKNLVEANRSYRRFYQNVPIARETLVELIELARLSSTGANLQPLKYVISVDPARNTLIYSCLKWAGYLKEWDGPSEGERPAGYITILLDHSISKKTICDQGIAAQSILLGAVELGLGGCIIGNIDRDELCRTLEITEQYEVLLVIALGKPKEVVKLVPLGADGDVKYYRDAEGVHYVPKRSLTDLILKP
jgi:nitroreductase